MMFRILDSDSDDEGKSDDDEDKIINYKDIFILWIIIVPFVFSTLDSTILFIIMWFIYVMYFGL